MQPAARSERGAAHGPQPSTASFGRSARPSEIARPLRIRPSSRHSGRERGTTTSVADVTSPGARPRRRSQRRDEGAPQRTQVSVTAASVQVRPIRDVRNPTGAAPAGQNRPPVVVRARHPVPPESPSPRASSQGSARPAGLSPCSRPTERCTSNSTDNRATGGQPTSAIGRHESRRSPGAIPTTAQTHPRHPATVSESTGSRQLEISNG